MQYIINEPVFDNCLFPEDFLKKYPKKPENDIKITWSEEKKSLMLDVKKNEY